MERHKCIVKRIEQMLADLAESIDNPDATDEKGKDSVAA
jgi:hypothetical protein